MASVETRYNVALVDVVARHVMGASCPGVSAGWYGTVIHAEGDTAEAQAVLILAGWASVSGTVSKTTITADGVDASVIEVNSASNIGWWLFDEDDVLVGTGTSAPVAGVCTMNFATDEPGSYTVLMLRGMDTGIVQIEAV